MHLFGLLMIFPLFHLGSSYLLTSTGPRSSRIVKGFISTLLTQKNIHPFAKNHFQKLSMSSMTTPAPKRFILEYKYVENMLERRAPFRAEHLANAEKLLKDNALIAGGAFMPNADGAMFIFQGDYEMVESFVQNDPYYKAGLIPSYSIREWSVVIGKL